MGHRFLITLTISIIYSTFLFAQKNCKISLNIVAGDYSGQYLKIGHYFGVKTLLIDSINVNKEGKVSFNDSIHPGILLLSTPAGNSFEFMIAESCVLDIGIVTENNQQRLNVSGNDKTEAFGRYLNQIALLENALDSLKIVSNGSDSYTERLAIQRVSKYLKDSVDIIIKEYFADYEGTLLGNYLHSLLPVSIPEIKIPPHISNPDSFRWIQSHIYFRKHYLDNVCFNDDGLIFTPVLEDMITRYFTRIIEKKPESITDAIDSILPALKNDEVYRFITELLIDTYSRSKHKAIEEYAYLHLVKNYYLSGKTPWATNQQIRILTDDYNRHKPASLHQKAPEIQLPDQYNKQHSLRNIQADLTIVLFWDYECPHCRRAIEDIRKVMQAYQDRNIQVFTIFTGKDRDVWKAFLARKIPHDWINTNLNNDISIMRSYNISQTPSIFLLGPHKTILDKNLTATTLKSCLEGHLIY